MAFIYKGGWGAPKFLTVLIKNSATIAVGEAVKGYSDGAVTNAVAGSPFLGFVHALVKGDGNVIPSTLPSAGIAGSSAVTTVTAGADNETTLLYYAVVDVSKSTWYSAQVSGTLNTTANSGKIAARVDVDSANTNYGRLLESTATRTVGTDANCAVLFTDLDDSTRVIVVNALSELDLNSQ